MNSKLIEIYESKKASLESLKTAVPLADLKKRACRRRSVRDFKAAIARDGQINVIAEIKKASPSAGTISADLDPVKLAKEYADAGAAALSVLTEEKYFKGELRYIAQVKDAVSLPVLRKDFIFDEYQVYESLDAGADAILLIAAILSPEMLADLVVLGKEQGLSCLVEVHDEKDLEAALGTAADIIGINNRDLNDFTIDMSTAERIAAGVPKGKAIVVESGIKGTDDIGRYYRQGLNSFLIGETLVRSGNIKETLRAFKGVVNGGQS